MKRRFAAALAALLLPATALAYTPNDPGLSQQAYLARIGAPAAWDVARGSAGVIVAVLDSGVDLSHPDLQGQFWTNAGEIPGDGIDNDGDGYVDDVHGWDFVGNTNDPEPDLSQGWLPGGANHGTLISGLIDATTDNKLGVAGLAWGVKIMPLKIVDVFGRGDSSKVVPALRYAVDHGARVINLSFSGTEIDPAMEAEIVRAYQKGVVVIAAAGNTHSGGTNLVAAPVYPACLREGNMRPVVGVAATDVHDALADFSNFGVDCVDIAAPGTDIYSTSLYRPTQGDFTEPYSGGWSGTSFSAPLVAGAAALLLSAHPSLSPDQVRTILELSADPILSTGTAPAGSAGVGRLNVAKALQIAGSFDGTGPAMPYTAPPAIPSAIVAPTPTPVFNRTVVNATLPPSAPIDSLVRLASQPAVYYVGLDGKRHPFPTLAMYRSWFADFSNVKVISADDMAAIPLGQPVLVRPGTYWVKIQSDPKTYYVEPDGYTLRWVKDEATAKILGGTDWAKRVIDVEPTYFSKFRVGPDLDTIVLSSSWPSGALVSAPGSKDVWYVDHGTRRHVEDLAQNKFQAAFVRPLAGAWQIFPEGLPVSAPSDDLFSSQLLTAPRP